jgi:hypothetical protein
VIGSDHPFNGGLGATVGVKYLGYRGSLVMAQNSRYDRFPLVVNGWRTIHPIPDKAPPLQDEEKGPLT